MTVRCGRVKGRRPRSIGRFSFLFRGAVLRPGGVAVNSQARKPLGHAVHAVPRSPGGAAAGGPQAANAWRSGPVGSFRRATGRTTAPPGLRRLALTPTQRLAPLAIDGCPSGAWRDSRTPTTWNKNGKRRLALNLQPFTAPGPLDLVILWIDRRCWENPSQGVALVGFRV